MNQHKIAIIILNWNGRNWLEKFLPSVIQNSPDILSKIYVADNNSSDDSISFLKNHYPDVQILLNKENAGYAGGYNFAIGLVQEPIICLLNSDIEVTANWLEPIWNTFESDANIAAIQPKILAYNDRAYFEYAGAGGGWIDTLAYPFCRGRIFDSTEKDHGQYNDITEIFWASGACLFVRRDVYISLGGLDADFFAHQEEIDLCWRMKNAGYKIFYNGKSTVYHVGGGSLPYGNQRKTYLNFRNNLFLMTKNLPISQLMWKLPVRLVLDGVAGAQTVLTNKNFTDVKAILKAHGHFYASFTKMWSKRKTTKNQTVGVYKKSIVFDYFVLKKKIFTDLF
ncbi:MAG: glycosyltransferase family 2 protein [Bacteroidetes bacterium]|nr:glycosyltransferase family 2 protein [Bacteroidota bacterium]